MIQKAENGVVRCVRGCSPLSVILMIYQFDILVNGLIDLAKKPPRSRGLFVNVFQLAGV